MVKPQKLHSWLFHSDKMLVGCYSVDLVFRNNGSNLWSTLSIQQQNFQLLSAVRSKILIVGGAPII